MALNERKRQQKLTKKKAKRKGAVFTIKREILPTTNLMHDPASLLLASRSAIHECLVSERLFENGVGYVVVTRYLPDGRFAMGAFLLDVFCQGVKEANAKALPPSDYRRHINLLKQSEPMAERDASYVRKLIETAEAYAESLGLTAHPDARLVKQLLIDADVTACAETFEFGQNGRPYFVSGPTDTAARIRFVVDTLTRKLGEDGFELTLTDEVLTA